MRLRSPFGILLVKGRDGLFRRRGPRGGEVTELGGALEQFSQRLPNGGEILVQLGRHFAQVVPLGRLGRQAEADTDRVDRLQRLFDARFRDLERLPSHVELFLS